MKNHAAVLLVSGAVLIAGCARPEPVRATELDEVVGNWESFRGASSAVQQRQTLEITQDGAVTYTLYNSSGRELRSITGDVWFDAGTMFVQIRCAGGDVGSYEAYLVGHGNLRLVPIDDECTVRRDAYAGQGEDADREWSAYP